jgi:hypothetical protein
LVCAPKLNTTSNKKTEGVSVKPVDREGKFLSRSQPFWLLQQVCILFGILPQQLFPLLAAAVRCFSSPLPLQYLYLERTIYHCHLSSKKGKLQFGLAPLRVLQYGVNATFQSTTLEKGPSDNNLLLQIPELDFRTQLQNNSCLWFFFPLTDIFS